MTALVEDISLQEQELAELVCAAQDGDREAFGELFRRCERSVYHAALKRLGDPFEAQELCQEVFVQAMQKLDQLRTPEAFPGWLQSITQRMAINRVVRHRPLVSADAPLLDGECVETDTPLDEALTHERHAQVRAGLGRLGRMDRETLTAFYVLGESLVTMSDKFRSPIGTIKRRLHVARKRLAKELEELAAV